MGFLPLSIFKLFIRKDDNFATWKKLFNIQHVWLLTCHSFGISEKCRFPPRLIQDVERIMNLRVHRWERPKAADGADDGYVLVHQRRHALAVQVAAAAVITCRRERCFPFRSSREPNDWFLLSHLSFEVHSSA